MIQKEYAVTIGIPTYRRSDLLDKTLNSIFLQTYKNIKIIVSDNGTDSDLITPIIDKYKKLLNIDFYQQKKNIGPINNFLYILDHFLWQLALFLFSLQDY